MPDPPPVAPTAPPPGYADAFNRHGQRIFVRQERVEELAALGGRLASPEEAAERRLAAEYERLPLAAKIGGFVTGQALPPAIQAWKEGAIEGMAGPVKPALSHLVGMVDPETGAKMRSQLQDLETAYPSTTTAGEMAGFLGGVVAGGALGKAGAALPSSAIARSGGFVAGKLGPRLAPLAAHGLGGEMAARAIVYGGQGAVEGAMLGAMDQLKRDLLQDDPELSAQQYAASAAHAGLWGLGLGAVTGGGSALGGAAARGLRRGLTGFGTSAEKGLLETVSKVKKGAVEAVEKGERFVDDLTGAHLDAMGNPLTVPKSAEWLTTTENLKRRGQTPHQRIAAAHEDMGKALTPEGLEKAIQADITRLEGRIGEAVDAIKAGAQGAEEAANVLRGRVQENRHMLAKFEREGKGEKALIRLLDEANAPELAKVPAADAAVSAAAREAGHVPVSVADEKLLGQAWRAVHPTAQINRELKKLGWSEGTMGKFLADEGVLDPRGWKEGLLGQKGALRTGVDELWDRSVALRSNVGQELGAVYKQTLGGHSQSTMGDLYEAMTSVRNGAMKNVGTRAKGTVSHLEAWRAETLEAMGAAPQDVAVVTRAERLARRGIDPGPDLLKRREDILNTWRKSAMDMPKLLEQRKGMDSWMFSPDSALAPNLKKQMLQAMRQQVDGLVVADIEATAHALGKPELVTEMFKLRERYRKAAFVHEAMFKSSAWTQQAMQRTAQPGFSALAGVATLNPIRAGYGIGRVVTALRGRQLAAWAMYNVGSIGAVQTAIREAEQVVTRAARGAVAPIETGAARSPRTPFRREPVKATDLRPARTPQAPREKTQQDTPAEMVRKAQGVVATVRRVQEDPSLLDTAMAPHADELAKIDPAFADEYRSTVVRGLALLASKLPERIDAADPLDPHQTPHLTPAEAQSILTTAAYVQRPQVVLEEMARGKVTPEGTEVLRGMTPRLYSELQKQVAAAIAYQASKGRDIPYEQRAKLSLLLDTPLDATFRPQTMIFIQNLTSPEASKDEGAGGGGGKGGPPAEKTQYDRIEEGSR